MERDIKSVIGAKGFDFFQRDSAGIDNKITLKLRKKFPKINSEMDIGLSVRKSVIRRISEWKKK